MSETRRFECPADICVIFDDDPEEGRRLASEWAGSLDLQDGDIVWLPEIGWTEKGAATH